MGQIIVASWRNKNTSGNYTGVGGKVCYIGSGPTSTVGDIKGTGVVAPSQAGYTSQLCGSF